MHPLRRGCGAGLLVEDVRLARTDALFNDFHGQVQTVEIKIEISGFTGRFRGWGLGVLLGLFQLRFFLWAILWHIGRSYAMGLGLRDVLFDATGAETM